MRIRARLNRKRLALLAWLSVGLGLLAGLLAPPAVSLIERHHPDLLRLLVGEARILAPPMRVTIRVDGVVQPEARCFEMKTWFDGTPMDRLVLWLPCASAWDGGLILAIDKDHGLVGDAGGRLYCHRLLVQSKLSSRIVSFTHPKSYEEDPHLEVGDRRIAFTMPKRHGGMPGKRIEIYL